MPLCPVDHRGRQAQLFTDHESVGAPRHPDAEAVGGAQGLKVKLAAGVLHPLGLQRKDFQFPVMGGGHDAAAFLPQRLDDRHRQGGALGRVGARAQLVQQHQRVRPRLFQYLHDIGDMPRKGGKALLNALLVADVHQDIPEQADLAALGGRDQKAAGGHGQQQARRFQADRLAAGVGAGDDHGVIVPADGDIHRHGLFFVQQRVPGVQQGKTVPLRHLRHRGGLVGRQLCFCQQQVHPQHGVVADPKQRLHGRHRPGKHR